MSKEFNPAPHDKHADGPRVGSLGPFRARWIVEWPCTSAALALRQMS